MNNILSIPYALHTNAQTTIVLLILLQRLKKTGIKPVFFNLVLVVQIALFSKFIVKIIQINSTLTVIVNIILKFYILN